MGTSSSSFAVDDRVRKLKLQGADGDVLSELREDLRRHGLGRDTAEDEFLRWIAVPGNARDPAAGGLEAAEAMLSPGGLRFYIARSNDDADGEGGDGGDGGNEAGRGDAGRSRVSPTFGGAQPLIDMATDNDVAIEVFLREGGAAHHDNDRLRAGTEPVGGGWYALGVAGSGGNRRFFYHARTDSTSWSDPRYPQEVIAAGSLPPPPPPPGWMSLGMLEPLAKVQSRTRSGADSVGFCECWSGDVVLPEDLQARLGAGVGRGGV